VNSIEISPLESALSGSWQLQNGKPAADEVARRIDRLVNDHLVLLATSSDGWSRLYKDPNDGRFWELTYPESHLHGGGAPQLLALDPTVALALYTLNSSKT
jgi:hypothetical protein